MVTRRGALVTLGVSAATLIQPKLTWATVARALTVAELTQASQSVLLGDPVEAYSEWTMVGDTRRIVTYTRVMVAEGVLGDTESEVMVRTLGGRVGKIGQLVHGEAALKLKERSLLFLQPTDEGPPRVTAMAQGHYLALPDEQGSVRLRVSPRLGTLLPSKGPAIEQLKGKRISEARALIVKAFRR